MSLDISSGVVKYISYELDSKKEGLIEYPRNIPGAGLTDCWGRNKEEIIISTVVKDNYIYLHFFDSSKQIITMTYKIPPPTEYMAGNDYSFMMISPDSKYLAVGHMHYGLWLINLETDEISEVINLNNKSFHGSMNSITLNDWSWDSKKIVMTIGHKVFTLNVSSFYDSISDKEVTKIERLLK